MGEPGTGADRVDFRCAGQAFSLYAETGLMGGFDGRDRRDLHLYALSDDKFGRLLVSLHENLHHELHWSTGWGVMAAFAGMLAEAGVDPTRMRGVADFANHACQRVHEVFATTSSVGALRVDEGRALLAGNDVYLDYLAEGLRVGGADHWPWQLRESAAQTLLRTLMQPMLVADVAEAGLDRLTVRRLAGSADGPDRRLALITEQAGEWWRDTFEELLAEYPDRGGDLGDTMGRRLPRGSEAFDRLRTWEETVLIPRVHEVAVLRLRGLGLPVLGDGDYLETAERLITSFRALAPDNWNVKIVTESGGTSVLPLGAERESVLLHDRPATVAIRSQQDLVADAREFALGKQGSHHVLGLYLHADALNRQFAGVPDILGERQTVLGLAGLPRSVASTDRTVPLVPLRAGLVPRDLVVMFSTMPVLLLTTLTTTRIPANQQHVTGLESCYILVDLPLNRQVDTWLTGGWTVRFRELELRGGRPVSCAVFGLDELPGCLFLSFRSDAGWTELQGLLGRRRGELAAALELDERTVTEIGWVTSWLMAAWWRFEEVDHW